MDPKMFLHFLHSGCQILNILVQKLAPKTPYIKRSGVLGLVLMMFLTVIGYQNIMLENFGPSPFFRRFRVSAGGVFIPLYSPLKNAHFGTKHVWGEGFNKKLTFFYPCIYSGRNLSQGNLTLSVLGL